MQNNVQCLVYFFALFCACRVNVCYVGVQQIAKHLNINFITTARQVQHCSSCDVLLAQSLPVLVPCLQLFCWFAAFFTQSLHSIHSVIPRLSLLVISLASLSLTIQFAVCLPVYKRYCNTSTQVQCQSLLTSHPGPAQLSVACSTVKRGKPGIISHMSMTQSKNGENLPN